jgi:hypothetical protein
VEEAVDVLEEIPAFAPLLRELGRREASDPLQRMMLHAAEAGPAGLARLCRLTGLGAEVAGRVIQELVRNGRMKRETGGRFRRIGPIRA